MDLAPIAGPQTWQHGGISPQDWVTLLPEAAVAELDAAVERLRREPQPAESVAPQDFDLPACAAVMNAARRKLDDTGLAVIDRVPVERYSVPENRAVGWLLASMLGPVVAQTWSGVRLYDVRDTGQKLGYGVRRSVTDLGQPFHTDAGWLWMPPAYVGLFCLESAPAGRGEPVRQPGDCAQRRRAAGARAPRAPVPPLRVGPAGRARARRAALRAPPGVRAR